MNKLKKIGLFNIIIGVILHFSTYFINYPITIRFFLISFFIGSGIALVFISRLDIWKD